MDPVQAFKMQVENNIEALGKDKEAHALSLRFSELTNKNGYTYNFTCLGRPIIQYPQDMVAMQEIIWRVRPDLIIETGIAHGGSLVMSAYMLAMLDYCDAVESGESLAPRAGKRRVLGVDIDIRSHNRTAIEAHPLAHKIEMIQGSSVAPDVVEEVWRRASGYERIMVCLDSNHTHDHVLAELEAYAPLVSAGSYCCVFDTLIEDMPPELFADRPWGKGCNPKTAVWEYLQRLQGAGRKGADGTPLLLEIDRGIQDKLVITVAPDGYLKRV